MHSIPPSPTQSTSIALASSIASPSSDSVVSIKSDQSQTGIKRDQMSSAPDCIHHQTSEWLAEKEMLSLMQTSKRNHQLVHQYYKAKLKTAEQVTTHPIRRYRDPSSRVDRALCLDRLGRDYLSALGIHYPLTAQIKSGRMTVEQAQKFIVGQWRLIQSTLISRSMPDRQKQFFTNSLFVEHLLHGRCDVEMAIHLSSKGINVFYSLTLQHLFRSGDLDPSDLQIISGPGLQLLHDPLLAGLFENGLLSKQDLLKLTQTQFESILVCRTLLMNRKLAMKDVLHQTVTKSAEMAAREVVTATPASDSGTTTELSDLLPVMEHTPSRTVIDSLRRDDGLEWLRQFGKVVHRLNPDTIIELMNSAERGNESTFEYYPIGLMSRGAEQSALAYIQVYINLAEHLNSDDYLRVVQSFFNQDFCWMIAESCVGNFHHILDQCCGVWALTREKCALNQTDFGSIRTRVVSQLKRKLADLSFYDSTARNTCLTSFARLLAVMGLLDGRESFHVWINTAITPGESIDKRRLHCFQALYSPFDDTDRGTEILDTVAQEIDRSNLVNY